METLFGADIGTSIFIILNLILLESLLSIDNAAVLASMVQDLQGEDKNKALRYGILGAYIMRGLCLLFASFLVKILWLKIAGGLYLCYLSYEFFKPKGIEDKTQDTVEKESNFIFRKFKKAFGLFWTTVILIEIMDLSFSIDNIFAAVAFTDKIGLIIIGVFIGILAMRFIAQYFVKLLEDYPFLERITFIVIALLGFKLMLSGVCDYLPGNPITPVLNNHYTDIIFSITVLFTFLIPVSVQYFKTSKA